jgi:hypothetical protein
MRKRIFTLSHNKRKSEGMLCIRERENPQDLHGNLYFPPNTAVPLSLIVVPFL